jgi:tetratricopeptide (TPR) repeat protein
VKKDMVIEYSFEKNNMVKAKECFEKYSEKVKDCILFGFLEIIYYRKLKKFDESIQSIEKSIDLSNKLKMNPNNYISEYGMVYHLILKLDLYDGIELERVN